MKGRRKFTVVLLPEEGDVYSVVCPALPGCVSQGDGLEGALANIQEAIAGILKLRRDKGLPLPTETPDIVADEIRALLHERADEGLPLRLETHEVEIDVEVEVPA